MNKKGMILSDRTIGLIIMAIALALILWAIYRGLSGGGSLVSGVFS